jgi:hypothetical protein
MSFTRVRCCREMFLSSYDACGAAALNYEVAELSKSSRRFSNRPKAPQAIDAWRVIPGPCLFRRLNRSIFRNRTR